MNMINFINKFSEFVVIIKFSDDNNNFGKIVVNHKYIDEYIDLIDFLNCFR